MTGVYPFSKVREDLEQGGFFHSEKNRLLVSQGEYMNKRTLKGTMVAAAVAGLFIAGAAHAESAPKAEKADMVKCMGANACKGHSACKTASNACAGQNGCGGKGFIKTATEAECVEKGGKVEK